MYINVWETLQQRLSWGIQLVHSLNTCYSSDRSQDLGTQFQVSDVKAATQPFGAQLLLPGVCISGRLRLRVLNTRTPVWDVGILTCQATLWFSAQHCASPICPGGRFAELVYRYGWMGLLWLCCRLLLRSAILDVWISVYFLIILGEAVVSVLTWVSAHLVALALGAVEAALLDPAGHGVQLGKTRKVAFCKDFGFFILPAACGVFSIDVYQDQNLQAFFTSAELVYIRWEFSIVFICISLITSEVEHTFKSLLAIQVSFCEVLVQVF